MSDFVQNAAALKGVPFTKMTGSGNDFVFFDSRDAPRDILSSPEIIAAICNRYNGIGADGLVILEAAMPEADVRILYFNSDGSLADLCGNATLCATALAGTSGLAPASGMRVATTAGVIAGRVTAAQPEIDLPLVVDIRPVLPIALSASETRIGFVHAGIPHIVVLCEDAESVNLAVRGRELRHHPAVGPAGANVNWVSARPDGAWRYRTFERGVEGETLACGTGAVATAIMLNTWRLAVQPVIIRTSSERDLVVNFHERGSVSGVMPMLRGEGRIVFRGVLDTLAR